MTPILPGAPIFPARVTSTKPTLPLFDLPEEIVPGSPIGFSSVVHQLFSLDDQLNSDVKRLVEKMMLCTVATSINHVAGER